MSIVAAVLTFLAAQEASTEGLIRDLDDDDIARRERAEQLLCDRGADVLPLLERATEAKGAERSLRARSAIDQILRRLRIRGVFSDPAPVDLRCVDRSVADLVQDLGRASGLSIALKAEAGWKRVTITEPSMTPMQALDAICARSGCEWSYVSSKIIEIREGPATVVPVSYESRFRFSLPHIETFRTRQADRTTGTLCLCIQADHEQGLKPVVPPEIVVEHVIDESGRELLTPREGPIRVDSCFREDEPLGDPERSFHSRPVLLTGKQSDLRKLSRISGHAVYHFALQEAVVDIPEVSSGAWVRHGDLEIGVFGLRAGVLQIRIQSDQGLTVPRGILNVPAIRIVDQDGGESQVPLHAVELRDVSTGGVSSLHYLLQFDALGQRFARKAQLRVVTESYEKKVSFSFSDVALP
jgi:hypothetical protein